MVGLVVVSHSRALAQAAVALARGLLPPAGPSGREVQIAEVQIAEVQIAVAAGLDDTTFGTDAGQIRDAITTADQGSGVVVLMDLGGAVLSAELARELLDDDTRSRVLLCPAPLVEGLIVAAVAAAGGATPEEVAAEASAALAAKTSHLGSLPEQKGDEPDLTSFGALTGTFTVATPHGWHARPAARLVQQVHEFEAQVCLRNRTTDSAWVPASSLSKVATLGALRGHEIEVWATGKQAQQALDHIRALASHDTDELTPPEPVTMRPRHAPSAAVPGIGIGPAWLITHTPRDIPDARTEDPVGEWRRLQEAIAAVRREVHQLQARAQRELGAANAAIFDAHVLLLDDTELLDEVRSRVAGGQAAAPAWAAAINRIGAELAAVADPYLQARAADLRAVGDQILDALLGVEHPHGSGPPRSAPEGVLVAADLTPAQAAELDRSRVAAVLLASGSATAHSVILLRARGIPAVVAAGADILGIASGTLLAVDGTTGEFLVDPPADVLELWRARAAHQAQRERQARRHATSAACTRDGVPVLVGANLGSVEDAQLATSSGADVAGLIRTEFLFLDRAQAPDVDEQETAYRSIAQALGGRRITVRTLDAGGDKPLDYLPTPSETNPFLGLRGIRLSLAHPVLLADQLLAIVRVAHDTPVTLLFPMISTVDEFMRARRMLDEAITLAGRGRPAGLQVGIMVEVPATALKAAAFAPHVDVFSIGTNDLTQYALAAERGNHAVAGVGDPLDPGTLLLVDAVCRGAGEQVPVVVCGELAADQRACAVLVGLGVRELSVTPRAVPAIKQTVRGMNSRDAAALAAAALTVESAGAVRDLLAQHPFDHQ